MKNGRWDPVAERLSRWARIELLGALTRVGLNQNNIAKLCGVSKSAVSRWVRNPIYHPNNQHTVKLLEAAWERSRSQVERILNLEAERFIEDMKRIEIELIGVST